MRWTLDVQEDESGECFIRLPEDLLEKVDWKIGQTLLWVDNKDGSWTLKAKDE